MTRLLLWLLCAAPALARVGGGQSYSGGGHSSSGGGGGDADGIFFLIELVFRLVFYFPKIGIPLVLICVVAFFVWSASQNTEHARLQQWSSDNTPIRSRSSPLDQLRAVDAHFSRVLFLDFVNLLYTRFQSELTKDGRELWAYVDPSLLARQRENAKKQGVTAVSDVIMGSIRITDVSGLADKTTTLTVALETNLTEHHGSRALPLFSVERWRLQRRTGVLSPEPAKVSASNCPSCGNPSEPDAQGVCRYCGNVISKGDFGWLLVNVEKVSRVERPLVALSSGGEEIGTDLPTRVAGDLDRSRRELLVRHPDFQWDAFKERAVTIFLSLQQSWSELRWELARPYQTDSLFQSHSRWIEAYREGGYVNRLEDVSVRAVEPARIETDAYYDAITVRIFASMKDFTTRADTGEVVSGNPHTLRSFSEYWTFVRRIGNTTPQPQGCPHCGAPLDRVNMSGVCEYCDTKVTNGQFDWVVSLIEQDEAFEP